MIGQIRLITATSSYHQALWWLASDIPHAVSQVLMNSALPIPLHLVAIELHFLDYVDVIRYVDFVEVAATPLADEMSVICWSADRYG